MFDTLKQKLKHVLNIGYPYCAETVAQARAEEVTKSRAEAVAGERAIATAYARVEVVIKPCVQAVAK